MPSASSRSAGPCSAPTSCASAGSSRRSRRAGYGERVASDVQRELIVEEAVQAASLDVLAESAAQPGFVRAATRFVTELGRSMVDPARFTRALRDWAGDGPRRAYAEEVAASTAATARARPRRPRRRRRVRMARARRPAGRPGRMGRHAPVRVRVRRLHRSSSTRWRRSRAAAARRERVAAVRARPRGLQGHRRHQAGAARARRGRAWRSSRSTCTTRRARAPPPPPGAAPVRGARQPVDPGAAISFHSAGGERAEVELAGARILELLREGVVPGDVAVVFRRPSSYASLLEQVFGAYGISRSIAASRSATPASGAGCWR